MKIAVDTSAIVAMLLEEPEAASFRRIVTLNEALVSGHVLVEAVIVLSARSHPEPVARLDRLIELSGVRYTAFDASMTRTAQQAFLDYGKGRHPARLNFGDCMSYAVAKSLAIPLLWKGDDFALTDIERAA